MKKIFIIFLLLVSILIPNSVYAISVSCRSCILMDMDSGRILYEKDANNPRLIASITKIMTSILAIESNKLDDIVTVGNEVLKMYGSNIYIEPGEKIKLKDLVYGLMLRSGNDAAVVIATFIAGSEENFVDMMNKKAKEIGMKNTYFNNSHGLDEVTQNESTAYDMAILSSYASKNKTYMEIVGTKKYTIKTNKKTYLWNNRNNLLFSYKYLTGGKTGYTPSAGKTLVTTASKNDLNLTAVALNDGNHYETHKTLYEYGFNNYKKYKILDTKRFKIDKKYYKDTIFIKNDFYYPLSEAEINKVKVLIKIAKLDNYKSYDEVGEVEVYLDNKIIFKEPIYVKINKKSGFLEKLKKFLNIK